MAID